tara:strand:+ start:455 stop:583 length:129 start_codon:yes stop_codon:yes gene_type:complete
MDDADDEAQTLQSLASSEAFNQHKLDKIEVSNANFQRNRNKV